MKIKFVLRGAGYGVGELLRHDNVDVAAGALGLVVEGIDQYVYLDHDLDLDLDLDQYLYLDQDLDLDRNLDVSSAGATKSLPC